MRSPLRRWWKRVVPYVPGEHLLKVDMNRTAISVLVCLVTVLPGLTAQQSNEEYIRSLDRRFITAGLPESQIVIACRGLFLDCVRFDEGDRIHALLNYLDRRITDPAVLPLWPGERILLSFWASEYSQILDADNLDRLDQADFSGFVLPPPDSLLENLRRYSAKRRKLLRAHVSSSSCSTQEQDFLLLFLEYLLLPGEDPVHRSAINRQADLFLLRYPRSPYAGFVRRDIRFVLQESAYGHALDLGIGSGSFGGRLASLFTDHGIVTLGYDFRWRQFVGSHQAMLSARVGAGIASRVRAPFTYHGDWSSGLRLNVYIPEVTVGLSATDNGTIRTSPFAGISGILIGPPGDGSDGRGAELNLVCYTVGITVDWTLNEATVDPENAVSGSWYLRTRLAFHAPLSPPEVRFNGNIVTLTMSVGSVGWMLVRDL